MSVAYWVPPALWMALILLLSTDAGSAQHTGRVLEPLLRWLRPGITPGQLAAAHAAIRKAAHLTEYAVLALLWFRAWRRGAGLRARASATRALAVSVAWAFLDEGQQLLVTSRTASLVDVAVDALGAAGALAVRAGHRVIRRSDGGRACRGARRQTG